MKRYESTEIIARFLSGCDAGDVAESDVAVCFDGYMQSDGRLRIVGYRRVGRKSARIGASGGTGSGEVEKSL